MSNRKIFKPWVKLHIRTLYNEDIAELTDSSKWKFIECLLLAGEERNRAIESGEEQDDGFLPPLKRMAYILRTTQPVLQDDLSRLAMAGLVELRQHPDGTDRWFMTHFAKWQERTGDAERQRFSRSTRKNEEEREEKEERDRVRVRIIDEQFSSQPSHKSVTKVLPASPTPTVITQSIDRTPKEFTAYAYEPPTEPTPVKAARPEAERQAIGHLINAIVDVTGKSAKLNADVIPFAEELYPLGYNAEQVRRAYSRHQTPGWNWYTHNWKGRDKNDMPTVKDIRETIAAATEEKKQARKVSQVDLALDAIARQKGVQ